MANVDRVEHGYRERLLPRWWAGVIAYVPLAMLAVAYGAALGSWWGWPIAVLGGALVTWLLWITSPVIRVDADGLRIAAAHLPWGAIGEPQECSAARIRELRGPGADARVFTALRPMTSSVGVLVPVCDESDPHPAWLVTSRHPSRLVKALTATIQATGMEPQGGGEHEQ